MPQPQDAEISLDLTPQKLLIYGEVPLHPKINVQFSLEEMLLLVRFTKNNTLTRPYSIFAPKFSNISPFFAFFLKNRTHALSF